MGVKTPVGRIVEFKLTRIAHRKRVHRRPLSVIRCLADDRIARTAVRAIGEGIAIPPVFRIADFTAAVVAGRNVRRNKGYRRRRRLTFNDEKVLLTAFSNRHKFQRIDLGRRRFLPLQGSDEFIQLGFAAFDFNMNAIGRIVHPAGQSASRRQSVDKRAEADALDDAANQDMPAHSFASRLFLPEIYYDRSRSKPFKETAANHA